MFIKSLNLYQFRNYCDEKVQFQNGINLLVGQNGQGKTNVLEGIFYLLTGKSHRIKQEKELILWGKNSFYLNGIFAISDRNIRLESYYEPHKKVMKINQLACKRLSDYVGTLNAVFFSPDDLTIIKKSPQERRRFLDLLIYQVRPGHISLLNSYLKIVKQKNMLLKQEKNISVLKKQLEVWNEQLIDTGTKIIINRSAFVDELKVYSKDIFSQIFADEAQMSLRYLVFGSKETGEAINLFSRMLYEKMTQEIEKRCVLFGPHRDDIEINLNGRPARLFASQGQQRALVLALKLSEMEIILNNKGEYPILLLDDVLSELDEARRKYLTEYISHNDKQTIITMTEAENRFSDHHTNLYKVDHGHIRRE